MLWFRFKSTQVAAQGREGPSFSDVDGCMQAKEMSSLVFDEAPPSFACLAAACLACGRNIFFACKD